MRSSLCGTDNASACDSRVNAQQSRAGSELLELNVRYAEGLGSVELLIDRLRRRLSGSICQSGVVRRVVRPSPGVVHSVLVLSVFLAIELHLLGGLLILVFAGLGKFDGEEGLHASVQVEGFAGPARLDGAGSGMLEAFHSS